MHIETLLISGDTCIEEIVSVMGPLLLGDPIETLYGFTWEREGRFVGDAERTGDYYDDDFGLPLSNYRFEISSQSPDSEQWMREVFDHLSTVTAFDLLWLTNMQRVNCERTLTLV